MGEQQNNFWFGGNFVIIFVICEDMKIGEIWEYRIDNRVEFDGSELFEIIEIDEVFDYIKVKSLKGPMIGLVMEFPLESFSMGSFRLWEDRYGVYCGSCGVYCEYMKFSNNFKCWACRNKW